MIFIFHTTFSDADNQPEKVFAIAKKMGLKAIVITEHDVIKGIKKCLQIAKKYGLETLEEIEISTGYKNWEIHILGYARRFNKKILQKGIKKIIKVQNLRAGEIIEKIKKTGIANLKFSELKNKRGKNSYVFKYDISRAIAQKKIMSLEKARKLMYKGGIGYVSLVKLKGIMLPQEAVKLIQKAKGFAVLAHPGEYLKNGIPKNELLKLIKLLKKNKLEGLEAISVKHNNWQNKFFSRMARKYNLFITGGSDWHGETKSPHLKMGSAGISLKEFYKFKNLIEKL